MHTESYMNSYSTKTDKNESAIASHQSRTGGAKQYSLSVVQSSATEQMTMSDCIKEMFKLERSKKECDTHHDSNA